EVSTVQISVSKELERAAMKVVCARLGHHIDDRSGTASIFSAEAVGLNAELLNRIRIGKRIVDVGVSILITAAVEVVIGRIRATAVGGNRHGAGISHGLHRIAASVGVAGLEVDGPRSKQDE